MKLDQFLDDATGMTAAWSTRQKHIALADMLNTSGHRTSRSTVEGWFFRKSIPGRWLMAIIAAAKANGRILDLNNYTDKEQPGG